MDKVNIGVIGLGGRGQSMIDPLLKMDDVNVVAVCDKYADRIEETISDIVEAGRPKPAGTADYMEVITNPEVDAVYIATDWATHVDIAIAAMGNGVFASFEVGGAITLDDCYRLVDTYERTGTWAMMAENCCYDRRELMITNMVRQGLFGKIVACAGKYAHDLRSEVAYGTKNRHYRLQNYLTRNCENYPTHELGPIAKLLDINRGNRFVSVQSICSGSYGMKDYVEKHEDLHDELLGRDFAQTDIVKTFIKTERGELIELTLDTTLARFYSRGFTVRGLKGMYQEDGDILYFDKPSFTKHDFDKKHFYNRAARYQKKYDHPLWQETTEEMLRFGHGGMDWFIHRAFIEAVKNSTPPPIDVYDSAAWMSIAPLSEMSMSSGKAVEAPDFTKGKYKNRTDHAEGKYDIDR